MSLSLRARGAALAFMNYSKDSVPGIQVGNLPEEAQPTRGVWATQDLLLILSRC